MELSILVAKIVGLTYFGAGIAALSSKTTFEKMIQNFEESPALTYLTGLVALIVGMILIQYHNIWVKDWTVAITLIGWASAIKGFMIIAFPGLLSVFKGFYKNTKAWGALMAIIGLVFGYFGFIANI